jgi:hypothetical protein
VSVLRPVFSDGAILAAADLASLGDTGRDRDARHARHLHTPGISRGMQLTTQDRTTAAGAAYKDVTLTPGYAVDGTGRELVLADPLPLSPDQFLADNPNPITEPGQTLTVWHPVFVHGVDDDVAAAAGITGCQAGGGSRRVGEDVDVEFGRPGDAGTAQATPAPDAGPGDGTWRVLAGFVRLDTAITRFTAVTTVADGITADASGARAALVAAPGTRVEVRAGESPDAGVPALVVDAAAGGSLVYGRHDGTGGFAPLLSVDAAGNLTVPGTLSGKLAAGTVLLAGGIASDGTVLPLPVGVDAGTVGSGGVEVLVHVTPRLPDPAGAPTAGAVFLPVECRVDADRRVHCAGRWFAGATLDPPVPASCDYVVLVTVPEGSA